MIARSIVRAGFASLLFAAAASLGAQHTNTVVGGYTNLRFSAGLLSALGTLDVHVAKIGPTNIVSGGVADFPVVGGALDLTTGHGDILHSGGLSFTSGSTKVILQSFIIDTTTGPNPTLVGIVSVNGKLLGPVPLFNIVVPGGLTVPYEPVNGEIVLNDVYMTLTQTAATALNGAFSVSAFVPNFVIGAGTVDLKVRAD